MSFEVQRNGTSHSLPSIGLGLTAAIFCSTAVLMLVGTRFVIPNLHELTGLEDILLWFLGDFLWVIVTGGAD